MKYSFEKLEVWNDARELQKDVMSLCRYVVVSTENLTV
jgi:hypothetical protein